MATELQGSVKSWAGSVDADGHREYKITMMTKGTLLDGPAQHIQTPGLPSEGSVYSVGNDIDIWAWCRSGPTEIRPQRTDGNNSFFLITFTFSTRPPGDKGSGGSTSSPSGRDDKGAKKKCADGRIENPLTEPPAISGSSIKMSEEAEFDQYGAPVAYTSFEQMRGAKVEFDWHREQVTIEQNVLNVEEDLLRSLVDKVNDAPMWGLPTRAWKLCDWNWSRKLYGTCGFYVTRRLTFESWAVEIPTTVDGAASVLFTRLNNFGFLTSYNGRYWLIGWDKVILDESNKVLNGHWHWLTGSWINDNINGAAPSATDFRHYIAARDRFGNPTRLVLSKSSAGNPATDASDANYKQIKKYNNASFLPLNIPTTLE